MDRYRKHEPSTTEDGVEHDQVAVCLECGALVVDKDAHDSWHVPDTPAEAEQ